MDYLIPQPAGKQIDSHRNIKHFHEDIKISPDKFMTPQDKKINWRKLLRDKNLGLVYKNCINAVPEGDPDLSYIYR